MQSNGLIQRSRTDTCTLTHDGRLLATFYSNHDRIPNPLMADQPVRARSKVREARHAIEQYKTTV